MWLIYTACVYLHLYSAYSINYPVLPETGSTVGLFPGHWQDRSGCRGWASLSQGLEVDRQRLFFWVGWASVLVLGDQVAQQHPEPHQEEPKNVGQHPLWSEQGVGGPGARHADRQLLRRGGRGRYEKDKAPQPIFYTICALNLPTNMQFMHNLFLLL